MQEDNALNELHWLYDSSNESLRKKQLHFVKFVVIKKMKKSDTKALCLNTKTFWF